MKQRIFQRRILAILTAVLLLSLQWSLFGGQKASAANVDNAAMVKVVDDNGKELLPLTIVKLSKNETAFNVLENLKKDKKIDFQFTVDPTYGEFITSIGKFIPKNQDYWGFFVNGIDPNVGASGYKVNDGDDLLFKVVSYPPETVKVNVEAKDKKGNTILKEEDVELINGANAYDALKQAASKKNVKLESSIDSSYFAFISNIGNTKLAEGDYWSISLNGKPMEVGLSSYEIKDKDKIQLNVVGTEPPTDTNDKNENPDKSNNSDGKIDDTQTKISKKQVEALLKSTANYVLKNGGSNEFEIVGLKKSGHPVPDSYLKNIESLLKENDGTFRNVTDYERLAIGITAAGKDASNFAGYNLIKKIYENERMTNQGTNGIIYALLALDSGKYKIPTDAEWTREKLVDYLVKNQLKDGGWPLYGDSASVDITAMALAALSPYKSQEKVKSAIDSAVEWLSRKQDKNGGFSSTINGGDASETTSQVIIGLTAIGVDPNGKQFTKSGVNLVQHLLSFKQKDGGFAHIITDNESNIIATVQALLGLSAYNEYLDGKGSIYQFAGSQSSNKPNEKPNEKLNEKPKTTNDNLPKDSNQQSEKTTKGERLPNTATNTYNILIFGVVLIILGGVLYVNARKKRV
ncbi:DUF4430 domain-containing protein [Heyndrickxia sporothermodurans]|uniref:DUF4430 domain-containing protein n=1 Tax=Heyndrickxia sporothermodurans TaxID=46224 RepID=A0AB37H7M8_9BACI|nr:DUF4430 domain-containing protein [Heyndrickxia sporothermodurans]MBL5767656.1 DUF4430 domain-containing protein [Heyndrickxia sporothermodurans]MBL5771159.1 DUF4430 domain-containing protein [Heyndrickxia sporothermodurans]MBL5775027.1 DUF4430 domain-containing protein [Heyndrickxia sporothermodurans]MBL5778230.1 DUF4430 domain-containing protein [Heyndrickxia sporothermodurans]MBL5781928.1 DUF4430 domain-containing protein [Heyndrickxia sporothermodurans]